MEPISTASVTAATTAATSAGNFIIGTMTNLAPLFFLVAGIMIVVGILYSVFQMRH